MAAHPDALVAAASAGFDLLLIAHVACALVGFGALGATGTQAARLAGAGPQGAGPGLRRYFAPGVNWAGRALYGVPVFGFALLADSGGRYRAGEPWVLAGLVLWAVSALIAEAVLWPAERRIQTALAGPADSSASTTLGRDCRLVAAVAAGLTVFFVAATVLMVAKPG